MLAPDDRSILRTLLRPPVDHELEIAVATSFTLDLSSALVAPLAFAAYEMDSSADPVALLEAVRSAADRVTIFSQVGHMRIPRVASDVMAFLEPMVHEVQAPNPGYLFHPKVWVLRYRGPDGELAYRLLCGTRNLTPDTSWDAVVALDGWVESYRPQATNRPLADLVRALPGLSLRPVSVERRTAIAELADELQTVTWECPPGVREIGFHVLGLERPGGRRLWDRMLGRRNVVVSPFLDDETVTWFRDESPTLTLISRVDALERLDPATIESLDCYVLDPLAAITDGASPDAKPATEPATKSSAATDTDAAGFTTRESTPDAPGVLGGLHAKVYVAETGANTRLLIGSANATSAGIDDGNVEFLVEMVGRSRDLGADRLLDGDGFGGLLQKYTPAGGRTLDPAEDAARALENLLRTIATRQYRAVVGSDATTWTEHITTEQSVDVPDDLRLTVGLLTQAGTVVDHSGGPVDAPFLVPTVADITPFVCIRLAQQIDGQHIQRSTIVRADLIGDPDGRLDEVLARQVDTPDKFLRFLMLLLALRDGRPAPPIEGDGSGQPWFAGALRTRGILESLLQALVEQPRVIDDLDRLVTRLRSTEAGAKVLPPGFDSLWTTVTDARTRLEVER